jgi:ferrous iron transport protein A
LKTLNQLKVGDKGVVAKVDAESELALRLFSFGVHKGADIRVKNVSLRRKTIEIEAGRTLVALRFDEAARISVEAA